MGWSAERPAERSAERGEGTERLSVERPADHSLRTSYANDLPTGAPAARSSSSAAPTSPLHWSSAAVTRSRLPSGHAEGAATTADRFARRCAGRSTAGVTAGACTGPTWDGEAVSGALSQVGPCRSERTTGVGAGELGRWDTPRRGLGRRPARTSVKARRSTMSDATGPVAPVAPTVQPIAASTATGSRLPARNCRSSTRRTEAASGPLTARRSASRAAACTPTSTRAAE